MEKKEEKIKDMDFFFKYGNKRKENKESIIVRILKKQRLVFRLSIRS